MSISPEHLYSNIYRHDYFGLKTDNEINYPKVASFLGFDHNDVSKLAGISKRSVRYDNKIPRELKDRLDEIYNIVSLVAEYFDGDPEKTALWFKSKNTMLGNITPRDMIRFGRYYKLLKFVQEANEASRVGEKNSPQKG